MSFHWLTSINCIENMERSRHYTKSHTPSWTVWRICALIKVIFTFQFPTSYFTKEIWKFGRTRNSVETLALRVRVPTSISSNLTSTRVSITVRKPFVLICPLLIAVVKISSNVYIIVIICVLVCRLTTIFTSFQWSISDFNNISSPPPPPPPPSIC